MINGGSIDDALDEARTYGFPGSFGRACSGRPEKNRSGYSAILGGIGEHQMNPLKQTAYPSNQISLIFLERGDDCGVSAEGPNRHYRRCLLPKNSQSFQRAPPTIAAYFERGLRLQFGQSEAMDKIINQFLP